MSTETVTSVYLNVSDFILDDMEKKKVDGDESKTWPEVPDRYHIDDMTNFFRKPDIGMNTDGSGTITSTGVVGKNLGELITIKMGELGLRKPRNAITKAVRGVGAGLLCATGIGAIYVAGRTRTVGPGKIGFYMSTLANKVRYVPAGISMEINPLHSKFEIFDIETEKIQFMGTVHIIKVKHGYYGIAYFNGAPRLLLPGENGQTGVHVIHDTEFKMGEIVLSTASKISAANLTIVNIKSGHIGAIQLDNLHFFLMEGTHMFNCANAHVGGQNDENTTYEFNDICYYVVKPGDIGGVQFNGVTNFITKPCVEFYKSAISEYMKPVSLTKDNVTFGSLTRILVDDYRRATIRRGDGVISVLPAGVHVIEVPDIHLSTVSTEWRHFKKAIKATTADPLDVKLTMTVAYKIIDPIAFYKSGDDADKSYQVIEEMAESQMHMIIRHVRFEAMREKYEQTLRAKTKNEIKLLEMTGDQEVEDTRVNAEHERRHKSRSLEAEDSKVKVNSEAYKVEVAAKTEASRIRVIAEAEAHRVQILADAKKSMCNAEVQLERDRIMASMFRDMKPKVFFGDPGKASIHEAVAKFVGSMTNVIGSGIGSVNMDGGGAADMDGKE